MEGKQLASAGLAKDGKMNELALQEEIAGDDVLVRMDE